MASSRCGRAVDLYYYYYYRTSAQIDARWTSTARHRGTGRFLAPGSESTGTGTPCVLSNFHFLRSSLPPTTAVPRADCPDTSGDVQGEQARLDARAGGGRGLRGPPISWPGSGFVFFPHLTPQPDTDGGGQAEPNKVSSPRLKLFRVLTGIRIPSQPLLANARRLKRLARRSPAKAA